jgi:nucleoside 2-deoxyribosyltransferase
MRVYIAGKLRNDSERERLEKIDALCKKHRFTTFLPHRDVGLVKSIENVDEIFKGDIVEGFKEVDLLLADLDGLHVGAGTAWEIGYAYALGIPVIGLKTDESPAEALEYLSAILLGSMKIFTSFNKLEDFLSHFISKKGTK